MSNFVFPLQKPSMSLEQATQQTIAHCQAGQWQEAESLYQALKQSQSSSTQGQYWLSYIDALIQAGKPRSAAPAPGIAPAAQTIQIAPPQEIEKAQEVKKTQERPASIKLARPPNPCYTAKRPGWPWKMDMGCGHVPSRGEIHLLLARYRDARYDEAETLARSVTRAFPRHDLGWKVLVAALRMQGRMVEAQQAQQQRESCHAGRRRNVLMAQQPI